MKRNSILLHPHAPLLFIAGLFLAALSSNPVQAFETYSDGCIDCHGNFRGPTTTKGTVFPGNNNHDMHRNAANMATACNLCHIGSSRLPVNIGSSTGTAHNIGIGCSGCHEPAGLRKHHKVNGTDCYDCHNPSETPQTENTKPPTTALLTPRSKIPPTPSSPRTRMKTGPWAISSAWITTATISTTSPITRSAPIKF